MEDTPSLAKPSTVISKCSDFWNEIGDNFAFYFTIFFIVIL